MFWRLSSPTARKEDQSWQVQTELFPQLRRCNLHRQTLFILHPEKWFAPLINIGMTRNMDYIVFIRCKPLAKSFQRACIFYVYLHR